MNVVEIRKKYIEFFTKSPRNHTEIPASPLVLEGDPTTLFTSSGMQQLVPFLKGEKHESGKRLVDSQPSLRLGDIDEIGDKRHTLFFEMLGNWSLGDYFKKDQLPWIWEFFTKELSLPKDKLYLTLFEGDTKVKKDEESFKILKDLGISEEKILFYPAKKNWWSRSGEPEKMPDGEIGGPDCEIFYDLGVERKIHENSVYRDQKCHPNCDCGRFVEIGNSVFIQYEKKGGNLVELPQKNVDFGGGLERIAMAVNSLDDIFMIDVFSPIITGLEKETGLKYGENVKTDISFRIVADHIRACVLLSAEGVVPSNKLQGYVLRRLLRRALFHCHLLGAGVSGGALVHISENLKDEYPIVKSNWKIVSDVITQEGSKFSDALGRGIKKLTKIVKGGEKIDGNMAFDLYQTEGFPLELTLEILSQNGIEFSKEDKKQFEDDFEKHKEKSRSASAHLFKGGLADSSIEVTKLHTTTHLLHASLRKILGSHVSQKGSNITAERMRFDFSHPEKLTEEEMEKVEKLINEKIEEGLPVNFKTESLKEAKEEGAVAFFGERYGEKVKVYTIGRNDKDFFSKEVCGGPHVQNTKEIGGIKLIKQEKLGANVVRIYARLDK